MSLNYDELQGLVIMNNSRLMHAGFSGDDSPRAVFPTVTGFIKYKAATLGAGQKSEFVGDEAISKHAILNLQYPIQKGIITNFDEMERIWHHTFYNELCVAPEEHPIFMSDSPGNTPRNRQKTMEIIFETFQSPAFYLEQNSVLTVISEGKETGTVVSMGHDYSSVTAVYERSTLSTVEMSDVSGSMLSHYFNDSIKKKTGLNFLKSWNDDEISYMKRTLCYVPLNEMMELENVEMKSFELPDGSYIELKNERIQCTEPLFDPKKYQSNSIPIHQMIWNCITSKPKELHSDLFSNIILEGGGSLFSGIEERLQYELEYLNSQNYCNYKIKVTGRPERKYHSWIGGSIVSSLSSFQDCWIEKSRYQEEGSNIINWLNPNIPQIVYSIRKQGGLKIEIVKFVKRKQTTDTNFTFV